MDYTDLIKSLEIEVGRGLSVETRKALLHIDIDSIPRTHRVQLANLAWRAGIPFQGLKILSPVIIGKKGELRDDATDKEELEYCIVLQRLGASQEALNRLSGISRDAFPVAHLYKAFSLFSQWRHKEAVSTIKDYLSIDSLTADERISGQFNLLKAYVADDDFEMVEPCYEVVMSLLEKARDKKLMGSAMELMAQSLLFSGEWEASERYLRQASAYVLNDGNYLDVKIKQWQCFFEAMRSNSVQPILSFKNKMRHFEQKEILRDCDLMQLRVEFDKNVFLRLVYGTPHEAYQKRILNFLDISQDPAKEQRLGPELGEAVKLFEGERQGEVIFNQGKDIHRLFYVLCSDLYRRWGIGTLHERIFPEELFNVYTSPNKIHQLMHRTRKILSDKNIKVEVVEDQNYYVVNADQQALVHRLKKTLPDANLIYIEKMQRHFGDREFTANELSKNLNLSKSSTQRLLFWCVGENRIEKLKMGRKVTYAILPPEGKKQIQVA